MIRPKYYLYSFLFVLSSLYHVSVQSQQTTEFVWMQPENEENFNFCGQGWDHKELKSPYDRLPSKVEGVVREAVWNLSRHTAGVYLNFVTDASEIRIRYQTNSRYEMPHMPATGVSGLDLYVRSNEPHPWLWCKGRYGFGDTINYIYSELNTRNPEPGKKYEYNLYLPLYNSIKWLEIGIPEGSTISPPTSPKGKPIVVYGTSIAQGGCASRPAMGWTSIVQRYLDRPVINLAFSGNGRLEEEVVDLIGEIDAELYILDCLPNLTSEETYPDSELRKRIIRSVLQLKKLHPTTPILLTAHAGYSEEEVAETSHYRVERVNRILEDTFYTLKNDGVTDIYLLPRYEIEMCMDCTVDGVHQTDLGMQYYADAYVKTIRRILN